MTDWAPETQGDNGAETRSLSPDELKQRVLDLEEQLESMRQRHQVEIRRSMETVERLQKDSGKESAKYQASHSHPDGYDVLTHQRVAVLVDVQNMYYAARNLYNSKLEFAKLLQFLTRNRMLTRALAYIVERPGMEQEKFVEVLRRNGFEVRKKVLIERSDGSQKGDWDLGIALDAVALADKTDVVILVTGDGDFVTLVHFLHSRGVRVEVGSFPETTALELIRSCDYYHRLNEKVLLPTGQFAPNQDGNETEPADKPTPRRPERTELNQLDDDDDFQL